MGLTDPSAAGFEAVLDLKKPTLVRADAVGPVGKPDSAIKVSSTQWILPGRDIVGDGWVLNFPGLVIEPTTSVSPDGALRISARKRRSKVSTSSFTPLSKTDWLRSGTPARARRRSAASASGVISAG